MDRLAAFCQANGIARLALFGSALREDFGPDSDIDLLVEFEPDCTPSLLALAGMEIVLSEMFDRKVDLINRKGVEASRNYIRRESILRMTETIYAAWRRRPDARHAAGGARRRGVRGRADPRRP